MIFGNESEVVCSQAITTKKGHIPCCTTIIDLWWTVQPTSTVPGCTEPIGWWFLLDQFLTPKKVCEAVYLHGDMGVNQMGWRLFLFLSLPAWTYCYFESWGVPSCFLAAFCCYLSDEFAFFLGALASGVLKRIRSVEEKLELSDSVVKSQQRPVYNFLLGLQMDYE